MQRRVRVDEVGRLLRRPVRHIGLDKIAIRRGGAGFLQHRCRSVHAEDACCGEALLENGGGIPGTASKIHDHAGALQADMGQQVERGTQTFIPEAQVLIGIPA